jgi:hypothetical protein
MHVEWEGLATEMQRSWDGSDDDAQFSGETVRKD